MLRRRGPVQSAFEMVSLEDLVPADHLFRKIEATVDFSFIHDRVVGLSGGGDTKTAPLPKTSSIPLLSKPLTMAWLGAR